MPQNRGFIHLLPLLLLGVVAFITIGLLLVYNGVVKNPAPSLLKLPGQKASVELKADYKNPLDKTSQYLNPFSAYKNPFDTLK